MFHPDRLTGARRRAWEKSCSYAPGYDWDSVPKTVREKIKDPFRLKALARVNNHWIAVIGHQVALIHHPHEDSEQAIHAIAGTKASERWACKCNTIRSYYATWTHRRNPEPKDKRPDAPPVEWADAVADLPEAFVAVREMCRPPTDREYRYHTEKSMYGRRRGTRRRFDWKSGVAKKPPKYSPVPLTRWEQTGLKEKIRDLARQEISERLSKAKGFPIAVKNSADYRLSDKFGCVRPEREGAAWELKCNFDPYTWYCRVRGRSWKHTPKHVVPVSMFRIGPVEVFFGIRTSGEKGVPADKYRTGSKAPQFEAVAWLPDGTVVLPGTQTYTSLAQVEFGLRTVHPKKTDPATGEVVDEDDDE